MATGLRTRMGRLEYTSFSFKKRWPAGGGMRAAIFPLDRGEIAEREVVCG